MKKKGKKSVRLKGVGSSVWVTVDPAEPTETVREEIDRLFKALNHPPENARVTLDVGEGDGREALFEELSAYLKEKFGVASVTPPSDEKMPEKKPTVSEDKIRKSPMEKSWDNYTTDVLMLTGRVRSGQKIAARNHLLLLGDVNPGAEVLAGGDILIMGSLMGTAIAGQPDNEKSIILALDFRPTQIQIGSYVAAGLPSSPGKEVEFAYVEQGNIVVEKYLDANPFGRMPWPEVR